MAYKTIWMLCCCLVLGLPSALAATSETDRTVCSANPDHLLIFDLTSDSPITGGDEKQGNRVFSFNPQACLTDSKGKCQNKKTIAARVKEAVEVCKPKPPDPQNPQPPDSGPCADATRDLMTDLAASTGQSTRRWISDKGDLLVGYVFRKGNREFDVNFDEPARDTRIATDLGTLLKVAQAFAGADAPVLGNTVNCFEYRLTETRANLAVTVVRKGVASSNRPRQNNTTPSPPTEGTPATPPANGPTGRRGSGNTSSDPQNLGDGEVVPVGGTENRIASTPAVAADEEFKAEITTGPKEHLFLSVDVPVENLNDTEVSDDGALQTKETPTDFLIGANYMLGDLFSETSRPWWTGTTIKLLVKGSSKPGDTLGFGLGYRFRSISIGGLDLDMFSLFAARLRVREDVATSDGESMTKTSYRNVVGISFNLDRALEWLGNDD